MAKYLDTPEISSELMGIIKEAKEKIVLVTFSLQVNSQIQERLKTRSKSGTLSEISIYYGNTKLKEAEIEWMEQIEDLKVYQKKNLHAKCYMNEEKAIITSMNLYDYSQTKNIEMGILITRKEDPEAYGKIVDDIINLKVNGTRIKDFKSLLSPKTVKLPPVEKPIEKKEIVEKSFNPYSYSQQLKKILLEKLRGYFSNQYKTKGEDILPDNLIDAIIKPSFIGKLELKAIINNDKKFKQLGKDIIEDLAKVENYVIAEVIDTKFQVDDFSYDEVKLADLATGEVTWFTTKKELPPKGSFLAARINGEWFNSYFVLEETNIQDEEPAKIELDNSTKKLLTTKELSKKTGETSRKVNSTLVSNGLMEKEEDDWILTKKGEFLGGVAKSGQYGQFIVWPEDIISEL